MIVGNKRWAMVQGFFLGEIFLGERSTVRGLSLSGDE